MKVSTGLVGQEDCTCWVKPAWYSAKREGVDWKRREGGRAGGVGVELLVEVAEAGGG